MKNKYIDDRKVDLAKHDILGTSIYADTLFEIITDSNISEKSSCIGLFGDWGSGKSSIISTLGEKLKSEIKIKFFEYDAWKHSEDSFRRSFIETLINEFKLQPTFDLRRLYASVTKEDEFIDKVNWLQFLRIIMFRLLPAIIIFYFIAPSDDFKLVVTAIMFFTLVASEYFVAGLGIKNVSIKGEVIFSQNQFFDIFKDIIKHSLTKEKNELLLKNDSKWIKKYPDKTYSSVVIVIDNIDRCDRETALKLLKSTKNFLEYSRCIFIIPIDDQAIRTQLVDYSEIESKEYLRKFFQTIIRIQKYSQSDIYNYAVRLIESNFNFEVSLNNKLAQLISQGFSNNPRRVIHLLNNLNTEISVYEKLDTDEIQLSNDVLFITKVLILKNEWSDLYNLISYDFSLLAKLEKCKIADTIDLSDHNFPNIDNKYLNLKDKRPKINLNKEEINYFRLTKNIRSPYPERYFTLNPNVFPLDAYIIQPFQDLFNFIDGNKHNTQEIVSSFERNLHQTINRRSSFNVGGSLILENAITLYNQDEKYSALKKIIDIYLTELNTQDFIDQNWGELLYSLAYKSNMPNDISATKMRKLLLDENLSEVEKWKLVDLLIGNPISFSLNDECKALITSRIVDTPDRYIPLNNDIKHNLSQDLLKQSISAINLKIDDEKSVIKNIKLLRTLYSMKLMSKDNKQLFISNIIQESDKVMEEYEKEILICLKEVSSEVDSNVLFNHIDEGVINHYNLTDDKKLLLFQIIKDKLEKGGTHGFKASIIEYISRHLVNDNDEIVNTSGDVAKLIIGNYVLAKNIFELGHRLVGEKIGNSKTSFSNKIINEIDNLNSSDIKESLPLLLDEEVYSRTHTKKLARKLNTDERNSKNLKDYLGQKKIDQIFNYKFLYSEEELVQITHKNFMSITHRNQELKDKVSNLKLFVSKNILDKALKKLKSANRFGGRRSSMCGTLNEIIESREE